MEYTERQKRRLALDRQDYQRRMSWLVLLYIVLFILFPIIGTMSWLVALGLFLVSCAVSALIVVLAWHRHCRRFDRRVLIENRKRATDHN